MRISRYFAWLAGAIIFASAILITLDVFFRNAFNVTFFESLELSQYGFAISCTFGMAYALTSKVHIRIDVVVGRFSIRTRAILDVMAMMILAVVVGVFAYYAWEVMLTSQRMHAKSASQLQMPLVVPQTIWAIGYSWFLVTIVVFLVRGAILLRRGQVEQVNSLIGIGSEVDDALDDARAAVAPVLEEGRP